MESHLDQTGFEAVVCLYRVVDGIAMSARASATLRLEIALQGDEVVQIILQERITKRIVGTFSSTVIPPDMEEMVLAIFEEIVDVAQQPSPQEHIQEVSTPVPLDWENFVEAVQFTPVCTTT